MITFDPARADALLDLNAVAGHRLGREGYACGACKYGYRPDGDECTACGESALDSVLFALFVLLLGGAVVGNLIMLIAPGVCYARLTRSDERRGPLKALSLVEALIKEGRKDSADRRNDPKKAHIEK